MGNCLWCRNEDPNLDENFTNGTRRNVRENWRSNQPGFIDSDPIMHPDPGISRPMSQLTEEEQVKIATRMGLISTLPLFYFDEDKREKLVECIICMCEYEVGEELRYLPCLHTYHRVCIDDWLMRALTCPSCLEELRPASPNGTRSVGSIRTGDRPVTAMNADQQSSVVTAPSNTEPPAYNTVTHQSSSGGDSEVLSTIASTNSHNTRSGGDGRNVVVSPGSARNHQPHLRGHRRTRSNGNTSRRADLPMARPSRHRRGNSASEMISSPNPTSGSDQRPSVAVGHRNVVEQLGGDSCETPHG